MRLYLFDSSSSRRSPFARPGVLMRAGPFAAIYLLSTLAMSLQRPMYDPVAALWAAGVFLATVAVVMVLPWDRLPPAVDLLPPLMMFGFTALVRHADGGTASGMSVLGLLPVVWLALYGRAWQLALGMVMLAAVLVGPVLMIGDPWYGPSDLLRAELWVLASGLLAVAIHQLVGEVKWHARQWERRAQMDPLTGLPNRLALESALSREISRAHRTDVPLTVAFLDLDHFKQYNDQHGHSAGDSLLVESAHRWQQQLRDTDMLARIGGEEFVAVFPGSDAAHAAEAVERLRQATPNGQCFSAGVAQLNNTDTLLRLLARADERLYEAKRSGRCRTVTGERDIPGEAMRLPLAESLPTTERLGREANWDSATVGGGNPSEADASELSDMGVPRGQVSRTESAE